MRALSAPASVDRRTAILDAAIEILADKGSKGLTHRAIDRHLGIPLGSTGAYHRTREALITATAKRVLELDQQAVEAVQSQMPDPKNLPEFLAGIVMSARAPKHRSRHLARYVVLGLAAKDRRLQGTMVQSRAAYTEIGEDLLRSAGFVEPEVAGATLGMFMNGLISDLVNYDHPLLTPDQVLDRIKRFLSSA
jgi:DNA-binding transcriptional regulator YbjK